MKDQPEQSTPTATDEQTRKAEREVREASNHWIAAFNRGDVAFCANSYTEDARMHAKPMGEFVGRDTILGFWSNFVTSTGATDLRYADVDLVVHAADRVQLSASWEMNVGRGIITNETWVRGADGKWLLAEDHFEVQEQF